MMTEHVLAAYLTTCFIGFFLIVCTKGMTQVSLIGIWIAIMSYFSLVHMLIKNFLSDVRPP